MKKPPTEEDKILHEGLMNPLEPDRFERLARRILRGMKLSPEREEKLWREILAGRAEAQAAFKRTLD